MENHMEKGIKELIDQNPVIADILNEYDIGCGPCNVGTCLLKDIVQIHSLAEADEKELYDRIDREIRFSDEGWRKMQK